MAKVPVYTQAWSPTTATYELYQTRDRGALNIIPGSPAWFAWLEQISSFVFFGKSGRYTARKEARQRGDRYWYAYLTTDERLAKKYLGKTATLTMARREQMAEELLTASETQISPLVSLAAITNSEVDSTQHPILAKHDPLYPLLATKLFVPRSHTHLVHRARLVERLQQGMARPLTLVSAPAGFGKTTLLAQWLAQSDLPVAWLSLEAEDNDPTRFLSYLIAALQKLNAQVGTIALALLRTPQPAPPEAVLTLLTNELIERRGGDIALVLDDYHAITDESIQQGMTFFLEHLPPQLHLVLVTRVDPSLPLARLRAGGLLTEVRTADLRFGGAEVGAFLRTVMGLDLDDQAITTLERHTEGWIACLQLAALSLQGRTDMSEFLATFRGSHRFVLDYLSEEVLARQPEEVQAFLLHTSILERLSGPLCDAVREQEGSQAMLEMLERANLFVVALDDERRWYRYHHLFAQVLRSHLRQTAPTLLPVLHRRASTWYEQHALYAESVQHALATPDAKLATRLIEPIALPAVSRGQVSTVLGWMNALPEALVQMHRYLCVYHAGLLTLINQLEAAETRLQQAERGVQELPAEQAQTIQGYMLAIRGYIALLSGDIPKAVSLAHQALVLLPEAEVIYHAGALATAIRSYLVTGDVTPTSEREVSEAVAFIRTSDNLFATVTSTTLLARLYILQGRLRQAAATCEQVVQLIPRPEILQTAPSSLYYYFGLGDLLRERNDLEVAERHFLQGIALVNETRTVEPPTAIWGYTTLARLKQARGNSRQALATLDALTRLAERRRFAPHR
jgi:LuxR family maltose regulon positive regulatory protein